MNKHTPHQHLSLGYGWHDHRSQMPYSYPKVFKNGVHTYTEAPNNMWKHSSPWGGDGQTYAQLPKILTDDEMYILVLLGEEGTQSRGCQRSELITFVEAQKRATEFLNRNPGGEALITKVHARMKATQNIEINTEFKF